MKNKAVAALLAFFLGAFGIHKFYLGYNFAGILYLIFSWTFIPSILALFDFIGLLLMSDAAFNSKYNNMPNQPQTMGPGRSAQTSTQTLVELKKLYDSGVITADEYEEKRRKYLDAL